MENNFKFFDEDLTKNVIKPCLRDEKYTECMDIIYDRIIHHMNHPLKVQIEGILQSFIKQYPTKSKELKSFKNADIKNKIIEIATLASAEMLFLLVKYYKSLMKVKQNLFQPLSQNVVKALFPSSFEFVCRCTKDNDFRFELQAKKYTACDLREVLKIKPKIFPLEYPSDSSSFKRTIGVLNKIEVSKTIDDMREELVNSQTAIIDDVKDMHNGRNDLW